MAVGGGEALLEPVHCNHVYSPLRWCEMRGIPHTIIVCGNYLIHPVGPSAGCDFVIGGCILHNDRKHEVLWRLKV